MSEEILELEELEQDYTPDLITLEDEIGKEHNFEVIDAADLDEVRYLALVPYEDNPAKQLEEDAEMIIMRLGEDAEGNEILEIVEDDEELLEVSNMFLKRLKEVYDFNLDDLENELNHE